MLGASTMDAIKKKMQAMRLERENAVIKAQTLEEKVAEQKGINEKVNTTSFRLYEYEWFFIYQTKLL